MTVEDRLTKLEKRHGLTSGILGLLVVALLGVTVYQAYQLHAVQTAKTLQLDALRVKSLRVYDDKGVDRVVIAGALPQAMLNGKTRTNFKPRQMGGILIYDATGTERGGYGTMDGYANALLTLDAQGQQSMLLLAEPTGGAFMRQWDGDASVTMGAYDTPFFTVMNGKDVVFAKPEGNAWTKRGVR